MEIKTRIKFLKYGDDFIHKGKPYRLGEKQKNGDYLCIPLNKKGGFQINKPVIFRSKK